MRHLSHAHSDHCPILLELDGSEGARLGERPFKFLDAWLMHADFMNWAKEEWRWTGDLPESLRSFKEKLICWNRDTFGNIHKKKRILERRMEGVARALTKRLLVGLLQLESSLKKDWADFLLQEEILWIQKFRIDWLRLGDRNTLFFHMSTLVRRRRNRVEMLKGDDGE